MNLEKTSIVTSIVIGIFTIIISAIVAHSVAFGVANQQNTWEEERIESELIVIDCHLEIIDSNDSPFEISNAENVKILKTNVTFVNQEYSKYPLKIVDSVLDYSGGVSGQKIPIVHSLNHKAIFSSEIGNIEFFTPLLYIGDYSAVLRIWYYDPSKDKIKLFEHEVYEVHTSNGTITPLQYYVTVAGLSYNDYKFTIHG